MGCGSDSAEKGAENNPTPDAGQTSTLPDSSDATARVDASTGNVIADTGTPPVVVPPVADAGSSTTVDADAGTPPVTSEPDAAAPVITADQQLELDLCKKFRDCTGINDGVLGVDYCKVDDEYARCVAKCVTGAECATVGKWFCGGDGAMGKGPVSTCVAQCPLAPTDGFLCGDGKRIPNQYVCDLGALLDCDDKSDEKNCALEFTCGSGEKLPLRFRCDGAKSCKDGSDEPAECAVCK